jgi:hypothetical protein
MARHGIPMPPASPAGPSRPSEGPPRLRQSVATARLARAVARVLLAPFALVVAAGAGLVFVFLLPVCGLASVAESISRASWALVRDTMSQFRAHPAPRN